MNHFTENTLMTAQLVTHKSRHVSHSIPSDQWSTLDGISEESFRDAFMGYGSRT